jgi:hypothetical protein
VIELWRPVLSLDDEEEDAADLASFGADRPVRPHLWQCVLLGEDLHAGVGGQGLS